MYQGPIPPHVRRKIGALAEVGEGTARRFWNGIPVRPIIRERLMRAAEQLGVAQQMPPEAPPASQGGDSPRWTVKTGQ